ncbi:MAG: cbb3-type cytochrome oxidase assembly protein CcoS [Phycisphaerae bacterium]|nr:cbb3-type cytochrome oxidase assembly protein CcoS [Phycisphaerae bacterium]
MTLVYLILPITFLIAGGFIAAFVWAARSGQFDDLATPPVRASFREADPGKPPVRPAPAESPPPGGR